MQKTKTVEIGTKSFLVRELSVRTIKELIDNQGQVDGVDKMKELLRLGCPDLTEDALLDMYPSEVEQLWNEFEEVNASFLGIIRKIGLDTVILQAVKIAVGTSISQSVSSSEQATAH